MREHSNTRQSLEEHLLRIRSRIGSSLNHVELLAAAAPFCAPLLELVREDLREAQAAVYEAERLERRLVRLLAGPTLRPVTADDPTEATEFE
jgi:hypothetical protein